MGEVEKNLKSLLDRGDIDSIRQAIELGDALNVDDKIFQPPISIFIYEYLEQSNRYIDMKGLSELEEVLSWIKRFRLKLLKDKVQKIVDKKDSYVVNIGYVLGQELDDNRLRAILTKAIEEYLDNAGVSLRDVKVIDGELKETLESLEDMIHDMAYEILGAKWITERL